MTIYELIKNYEIESKNEKKILEIIKTISEHLENFKETNHNEYLNMINDIYSIISNGHYDKYFADCEISNFYFISEDGKKNYAPYWNENIIEEIYSNIKQKIPNEYTMYDFLVTMNMMKADNFCMISKWFKNEQDINIDNLLVDMAVNYLNDPDAKHPKSKIWNYLH